MDEEGFKKTCIKKKKKRGGIQQPLYGTWVADFMLRQDAGRFMLGKYLSDKKNSTFPIYHSFSQILSSATCISEYIKISSKYL